MGNTSKEDDFTLDFSAVSGFFKKLSAKGIKPQHWIAGILLVFLLGFVLYIRLLPASLPMTDDWAAQTIQNNLKSQISQQISQQYPHLPQANRDQLVNEQLQQALQTQSAQYDATVQQLSQQFKDRMRYVGENGKQYTYLGDLDSYFWLRYTRNWLDHGYACDTIIDGQCIDTYVNAPIGSTMGFHPTLHVFAIGWLHKFITLFDPLHPLPATSYLVPVLIGLLGVIPAFFLGRKLAGNAGGLVAAVLTMLHPLLLSRSIGSDNDVWNVVLPMFTMWFAVEATLAKDWKKASIFGGLAGLALAIHAATWAGWWFIYVVIFLGLLAALGYRIVRTTLEHKRKRFWEGSEAAIAAFVAFYLIGFIFIVLFSDTTISGYLHTPLQVFGASQSLDQAVQESFWPNVLTTVAELNKSNFGQAIGQFWGSTYFFGALLGLLLLLLPRDLKKWGWEQYGLLALGAIISIYLLKNPDLGKFTILFLLGLPIGLTLVLDLYRKYEIEVGAALIVLVWFAAAMYTVYSGVRFLMLLIPAFGVAFAVLIGRVAEGIELLATKPWQRWAYQLVGIGVAFMVLIVPLQTAYATAYQFAPTIDDGWWDALTNIRDTSQPDAIINSWWDFGHWFKYVADRRVTADGTTQGTHTPRWLGLALVTPSERQSMGTLRMLDCGSDTYPGYGGTEGAYGYIVTQIDDEIRAEQIVVELTKMDASKARPYLAGEGFSASQVDEILSRVYCDAPEDYFITSGDMVGKAGVWAHFGLWDFERAFIVKESQSDLPQQQVIDEIVQRFGTDPKEAQDLYYQARGLTDEGQINAWVSPWPGFITGDWIGGCQDLNESGVVCPLQIGVSNQGTTQTIIDRFVYNVTDPNSSALRYSIYQNGRLAQSQYVSPAALIVAGDTLRTYDLAQANSVGVLYDAKQGRLMLGDPTLLGSVFTQLYYLDGRYNEYFKKFDERQTLSGSRIVVWKVDWNGE